MLAPVGLYVGLCGHHVGLQVGSKSESPTKFAYVGPCWAPRANPHLLLLAYVGMCWPMWAPCWLQEPIPPNSVSLFWSFLGSKLAPRANPNLILGGYPKGARRQYAYVGTMLGSKLAPRTNRHLILSAYVGPCWPMLTHVGIQPPRMTRSCITRN